MQVGLGRSARNGDSKRTTRFHVSRAGKANGQRGVTMYFLSTKFSASQRVRKKALPNCHPPLDSPALHPHTHQPPHASTTPLLVILSHGLDAGEHRVFDKLLATRAVRALARLAVNIETPVYQHADNKNSDSTKIATTTQLCNQYMHRHEQELQARNDVRTHTMTDDHTHMKRPRSGRLSMYLNRLLILYSISSWSGLSFFRWVSYMSVTPRQRGTRKRKKSTSTQ